MVAGQYHSNMANVTEISQFDAGIYQLEITDVVEGGALGVDNYQAKGLANRTRWLYDQIVALFKFAPKNRGYFTGLDVGASVGSLGVSGNITSAIASESGNNTLVLVTMQNSMGNTNYKVKIDIESLSASIYSDNNISAPIFRKISATQFQFGIREFASEGQNLRIHLEVISLD